MDISHNINLKVLIVILLAGICAFWPQKSCGNSKEDEYNRPFNRIDAEIIRKMTKYMRDCNDTISAFIIKQRYKARWPISSDPGSREDVLLYLFENGYFFMSGYGYPLTIVSTTGVNSMGRWSETESCIYLQSDTTYRSSTDMMKEPCPFCTPICYEFHDMPLYKKDTKLIIKSCHRDCCRETSPSMKDHCYYYYKSNRFFRTYCNAADCKNKWWDDQMVCQRIAFTILEERDAIWEWK
ncbi:MAG: hypothetical protein MJZ82_05220 [Paludibacteraceae bacterium]|nr:hypothetical protein [Paludibacteraceae bacterium]